MKRKSRQDEIKELQEKVFGKNAPKRTFLVDSQSMLEEARKEEKKLDELESAMNQRLQANLEEIQKMTSSFSSDVNLEDLKKEIEKDFGISVDVKSREKVDFSDEVFKRVVERVNSKVMGQADFVYKLVLGFRRPFVMDHGSCIKNTMLLLGNRGSGKHFALHETLCSLYDEKIMDSCGYDTLDLGLYTTQEDEKLLLQDLFSAIKSKNDVIVFENVEYCYPAYLTMIADVLTKGKVALKNRYVVNNQQLVSTNNALMDQTVSVLEVNGKYLVCLSSLSKEKLVDLLGVEVVRSFKDVIETTPFDKGSILLLAKKAIDELIDRANALHIQLECDESISNYFIDHFLMGQGYYSLQAMQNECLALLSQYRLENACQGMEMVVLRRNMEWEMVIGEKVISYSSCIKEDTVEIEKIKKELDEIVGLEDVKQYVLSLEAYFNVQKMRELKGMKTSEVAKHMIFTGNPGTGKTTIARIIAKYLRAIGVLSGGQLVEVTRADLVGRYVGHTAPLTMQVIKSALGGVLFIDEAYALYRGKDDNFGLECIDTLVKGMEDYRDEVVVILAGYQKEMEVFLSSNSGLKSRFPNVIHFKDYTAEELLLIAKSIAKSKEYTILPECDDALLMYFDKIQKDDTKISGNGRLARNKVEEAILQQSFRIMKQPDAKLDELQLEDFKLDDSSFVE